MIPDAHTNTSHLIITSFVAEHFYFVVVTVTPCLTVIPRLVMNSPFGGRITDVLIWPHLRCNSPEVPEQPCGKSIKRETLRLVRTQTSNFSENLILHINTTHVLIIFYTFLMFFAAVCVHARSSSSTRWQQTDTNNAKQPLEFLWNHCLETGNPVFLTVQCPPVFGTLAAKRAKGLHEKNKTCSEQQWAHYWTE